MDDLAEWEDLAEVLRTVKLSLFRQLIVTLSCTPPDQLTILPLHELVDLLEALPSTFSNPPAIDMTIQLSRSSIDPPHSSPVASSPHTSASPPHALAPPGPHTYLLDRITQKNPYEWIHSIIRIRQKAFSRWTVAMRWLPDLPPQQHNDKCEDIAKVFSEKHQYWADIIIQLGGSFQEAWGGVPEILQEFV
jgi:hypothetical protein